MGTGTTGNDRGRPGERPWRDVSRPRVFRQNGFFCDTVHAKENGRERPTFRLYQNYPNPFNPTTAVSAQWSVASDIHLIVFDILGREVAVLANGRYPAGKYSFTFNAKNLASGVYFCRLKANDFVQTLKLLLIR